MTGRRKALLIGINYIGSKNALRGCINDAHNIFNYLTTYCGYRPEDIVMLTDDQREMVKIPLKENIIRAMQWLVKDAQPNDALFFITLVMVDRQRIWMAMKKMEWMTLSTL